MILWRSSLDDDQDAIDDEESSIAWLKGEDFEKNTKKITKYQREMEKKGYEVGQEVTHS